MGMGYNSDLGMLVQSISAGMKTVAAEGNHLLQEADYLLFYLSSFRGTPGKMAGSMAAAAAFFGGCGPQVCEISYDCDSGEVCSSANVCVNAIDDPEEACGDSPLKGKVLLDVDTNQCRNIHMIYFRQRDCAAVVFGPTPKGEQLELAYWEAPEATNKAFRAAGNSNLGFYGYRSGVGVILYSLSTLNDIFKENVLGMEITDLRNVQATYRGFLALGLNPFVDLRCYPTCFTEKGAWSWEVVEREFRAYVESKLPSLSDPFNDFRLPGEHYVEIDHLLTRQTCEELLPTN